MRVRFTGSLSRMAAKMNTKTLLVWFKALAMDVWVYFIPPIQITMER
jgi:hypothetical protein